jgi:hypothetical protein
MAACAGMTENYVFRLFATPSYMMDSQKVFFLQLAEKSEKK